MNKRPRSEGALQRAHDFLAKEEWVAAFTEFSTADRENPLGAEDLLAASLLANLLGRDREYVSFLTRAHQSFQRAGNARSAVRCAFWLGFSAMLSGDMTQASGWLARARRLLDDCAEQTPDGCVEEGYLLLPVGYQSVHAGEADVALAAFAEASEIGVRFGDRDLIALGRQGQGRALIRKGEVPRGVVMLDEVMVGVTAGEVSLNVAGGVYCSVLEACGEIFDLRRAQEWTTALDQWCSSHPDFVPYRGHCQIRRAEILQLRGRWNEALEASQLCCEEIPKSNPSSLAGSAFYRIAEIHRLRGDFAEAEVAYRKANQLGLTHQPGMALLQLAMGHLDSAIAAIRNLAQTTKNASARAIVLDGCVEVYLAASDIAAARSAADELSEFANRFDAPLLHAIAYRANGAVLIAEHQAALAQDMLRRSLTHWLELDAPYEAARVRMLLGMACLAQGDQTTAELELDAARNSFQQIGAKPDLVRVDNVIHQRRSASDGALTAREREVLSLVATGKTNRAIAKKLFISEKTVARHVSNIFLKLDISSRAAATAYAYENKLV